MKVLTIGGATQDSIINYKNAETLNLHSSRGTLSYLLFEEGKKIEVTDLSVATGGGATNSAVCFKLLGCDVSSCFKVGADDFGKRIVRELDNFGVDTSPAVISQESATACSFIVPSLHGDRTVFAYRGANATLHKEDLPLAVVENFNQLYITSLSGSSAQQLPVLTKKAKDDGIRVAINPGYSQLKAGADFIAQSLPYIDTLLLNETEAKELMLSLVREQVGSHEQIKVTGEGSVEQAELIHRSITHEEINFNLLEFFQRVQALGPKVVVVTHGKEGVYVAVKDTVYFHPSISENPVNTIGAGDAFSSSFVAGRALGQSVANAIRWGVVNSASVVNTVDAKSGLLSQVDLIKKVEQLDPAALIEYQR